VAESWEISDDGLIYTFNIRENANWSNGDPVTAHDFVYSLRRSLEDAGMTVIRVSRGDYADACLLPGDPLRAQYIAGRLLDAMRAESFFIIVGPPWEP
jgi:ABC-type transport system substrate-binding protein